MLKRKRIALFLPAALFLGFLCFLGMRAASHEGTTPVVQVATVAAASDKIDAAPGSESEIQDYGRRQSRDPGLSDFAGGHHEDEVIIVGTGCGCLLIAILVLVILL